MVLLRLSVKQLPFIAVSNFEVSLLFLGANMDAVAEADGTKEYFFDKMYVQNTVFQL